MTLVDPVTGVYDRRAIMKLAAANYDAQPFWLDRQAGRASALLKAWNRARDYRTRWNIQHGHCSPVPAHEAAELARD